MPSLRPLVHRHVGDVLPVEDDLPFLRLDQAHDHVEGRRLSGAVWSEKSDDLALLQAQTDVVDDRTSAIGLYQPFASRMLPPGDHLRRMQRAR